MAALAFGSRGLSAPSPGAAAGAAEGWRADPAALAAATVPPEARGVARDGVRLLVSSDEGRHLMHLTYGELPDALRPGDLLVVNVSQTRPASLPVSRSGERVRLHLSTQLPGDVWIVELRRETADGFGTRPLFEAKAGEWLGLPEGGSARLLTAYRREERGGSGPVRLWLADLSVRSRIDDYLERVGEPVRYDYSDRAWPMAAYRTDVGRAPGSAEMPSAGRGLTPRVLGALERRRIEVAELVLHCGVSSLEAGEAPHEEAFEVPWPTAEAVWRARSRGGRVVAVGTTVLRALESVTDGAGRVHAGSGHTRLVLGPDWPVSSVDGLISGFHPPGASHLRVLESLVGPAHLGRAYAEAAAAGYRSHELGDAHLIWREGSS